MKDQWGRKIDYMRISVTDCCNLRCRFCMPENSSISFLKKEELLTIEEIKKITEAAADAGIEKFKITGGEPLLREGVLELIKYIKNIPGVKKATLTTNGVFLFKNAEELSKSGIDAVNVSLSSLNPEIYKYITGRDKLSEVLKGIEKISELGILTKINCAVIKEINEKGILDLAEIAEKKNIDVRFIEMMPVGEGINFKTVLNSEILKNLEKKFGVSKPDNSWHGNGPAEYYRFKNFKGSIGFISAKSHEFCSSCNRIRLTADGYIKLCLNYNEGADIKSLLREGASRKELKEFIKNVVLKKPEHHDFNSEGREKRVYKKNTAIMSKIGG